MKNIQIRLLVLVVGSLISWNAQTILAQCGADGTKPCGQTTKPKTIKNTTKKTTPKPPVENPKTVPNQPKKETVPTVIVNSNGQMIGTSPKGDKLEIVSFEYDKKLEGSKYQSIIATFKYGLVSSPSCRIWLEAYSKGKEVTVAYGGSNKYSGDGEDSNYVMWDREKIVDEFHARMAFSDGNRIRTLFILVVKLKKQ